MTRAITYFENEYSHGKVEPVEKGGAIFHCFSQSYEEFENGPGNFAVAVIETLDGQVKIVPAENIKFSETAKDGATK